MASYYRGFGLQKCLFRVGSGGERVDMYVTEMPGLLDKTGLEESAATGSVGKDVECARSFVAKDKPLPRGTFQIEDSSRRKDIQYRKYESSGNIGNLCV